MGLDIYAMSKAVKVPCRWTNATDEEVEQCENLHTTVGAVYRRRDTIKTGCYVRAKGGRQFDFEAGTGAGYSAWLDDLSPFALGDAAEEVWDYPRRYQTKPFFELINHPDSSGFAIGPVISAKLFKDFAAFSARAKKHYFEPAVSSKPAATARKKPHRNNAGAAGAAMVAAALGAKLAASPDNRWMWETYQGFERAFKLASDDGFVLFC